MRDIDRALADISAIREQVAMSSLFRGLGPAALAATGFLALGVAAFQSVVMDVATSDPVSFFTVWVATAVAAVGILGSEIARRWRKDRSSLATTLLQNALLQFLPVGMAGAALLVLALSSAPDVLWMLPGLWQILVALGIFAAARLLPGQTMLAAAWYFLSGFCVLLMASRGHTLSPWFMGIPFFVGQCLMAAVTWHATEKKHGK